MNDEASKSSMWMRLSWVSKKRVYFVLGSRMLAKDIKIEILSLHEDSKITERPVFTIWKVLYFHIPFALNQHFPIFLISH